MKRLRSFIANLQSVESLLKQLRSPSNSDALAALGALKERMAHQDGTLRQLDLGGANLDGATFAASDFTQTNFCNATLQDTYFFEVQAAGATFDRANLNRANLRAANLQRASLQNTILSNANLARADLREANLQGANLRNVNLWQTTLIGADLSGADLTGANVSEVICDEMTLLPDGTPWSAEVNWAAFTHEAG